MAKKNNRIGEEKISKSGLKMIIVGYNTNVDINVYFPEYNWTKYRASYDSFKKGSLKCPYEPTVYGKGYIGEGPYVISEDGEHTRCYTTWKNMLNRCYNKNQCFRNPTYEGCEVDDEWLNYQIFAEWYYDNYYEIEGEHISLDKDILYKGNKLYSANTCIFVPQRINNLIVKANGLRGELPIGVCKDKNNNFISYCSDGEGNTVYIGTHTTVIDAFNSYKQYKENLLKQIADEYKDNIPFILFDALYSYQVEIID